MDGGKERGHGRRHVQHGRGVFALLANQTFFFLGARTAKVECQKIQTDHC